MLTIVRHERLVKSDGTRRVTIRLLLTRETKNSIARFGHHRAVTKISEALRQIPFNGIRVNTQIFLLRLVIRL